MAGGRDQRDSAGARGAGGEARGEEARPEPALRRVLLRDPGNALEIGRNDRVVASHYREGADAWEVLLETYD